jgi:hypothetical protein
MARRARCEDKDKEIPMARAYGSSAHLLMKCETTYGQAATGNYIRMPFNRCNLGSEQGLIDDPVLGQGRDPLAPPAAITSPCFRNCCRRPRQALPRRCASARMDLIEA